MTFTSIHFAIFLVVTFCAYYSLGRSGAQQLAILVAASLIFYAWDNPWLVTLLALVVAIASSCSLIVSAGVSHRVRSATMWSSLALLLGILAFFKYSGLFYSTLVGIG